MGRYAAGRYHLGLTAAEFWELTDAKFWRMWRLYAQEQEDQTRRFLTLLAGVYNLFRDSEKKPDPFTADDWMKPQEQEQHVEKWAEGQVSKLAGLPMRKTVFNG